jgi:hypothetical protein
MAKFMVRQRFVSYEDFEAEAESAEEAVDLVNQGAFDGNGPEYLETTATYILDGDGVFSSKDQPWNATLPD